MDAEKIRQAAISHFKATGRGELKSVPVPEWGDDCRIYFYPSLNVGEIEQIAPFIGVNSQTMYLKTFLLSARDEKGERLWSMAAEDDIRSGTSQLDPMLINRIVDDMGVLKDNEDAEALAKKQ